MLPRRHSLPEVLVVLLAFLASAHALHFYLDANEQRCFIEELPNDTVVEGHYRALEWSEQQQAYIESSSLGIQVEVTETDSGHNVVKTRGPHDGKFTFTSHEAGDHLICLSTTKSPTSPNSNTVFGGHASHIRLYLDITVGTTRANVEEDRSHVAMLAQKIRDLNDKMEDIRREQQYQRERETAFRDLSESTNARAVWYSVAQISVLVATCMWQLRHLRRFFEDRKVR